MIHYKLKSYFTCAAVLTSMLFVSTPVLGMWEQEDDAPAATKKTPESPYVATGKEQENTPEKELEIQQSEQAPESPYVATGEVDEGGGNNLYKTLKAKDPTKLDLYERVTLRKHERRMELQKQKENQENKEEPGTPKRHLIDPEEFIKVPPIELDNISKEDTSILEEEDAGDIPKVIYLRRKAIKSEKLGQELVELSHAELAVRPNMLPKYGKKVLKMELTFFCEPIVDSDVKYVIENCPNLIELRLCNGEITDTSLESIGRIYPNLTYLDLSKCIKITDAGIIAILSLCTKLTYLNLSECSGLTDATITSMATHCTELEELNLAGCVSMQEESNLIRLTKLSNLKILRTPICKKVGSPRSLVGYYGTREDVRAYLGTLKEKEGAKGEGQIIPTVKGLTKHVSLRFSKVPSHSYMPDPRKPILDPGPPSNLEADLQLSQRLVELTPNNLDISTIQWDLITKLNLKGGWQNAPNSQQESDNHWQVIQDFHVKFVAERCKPDRLIELHLCNSEVTDESLKLIGEHFPRLVHLNLSSCCKITDNGLIHLTGKCPKLTHLDISNCGHITNKGLESLLAMCPKLSHLNVSQCLNIGDKIINTIVTHCSDLKELNLSGCKNIEEAVTIRGLSWNLIKLEILYPPTGDRVTKRHSSMGSIEESRKSSPVPEKMKRNTRTMSASTMAEPTNRFLPTPSDHSQHRPGRRPQGIGSMRMSGKLVEVSCNELDATPNLLTTSGHSITKLKLNATKLNPIQDPHFECVLMNCPNLTELYLSESEITDISLKLIEEQFLDITHLTLSSCCNLTGNGLKHLIGKCPRLTHLDISNCKHITNKGLESLLEHCTKLTHLDVSECDKIKKNIIAYMANCCANLVELNLRGTKIEEKYLLKLNTLRKLQKLSIPLAQVAGAEGRWIGVYNSTEEITEYLDNITGKK